MWGQHLLNLALSRFTVNHPICTCTVQLTPNLNASVEYERFYSRASMCKTRALVLELHSKIGPLALERSILDSYSTRALQ